MLSLCAALFVRPSSVYKTILGVDCFDIERDARTFAGTCPVIAHPPCRAWSRLRHLAKPRPDEKQLAFWAVECVRRNGGVLEHPSGSLLWAEAGLPPLVSGARDAFGGFSFAVDQSWFGHRAPKRTWLYVCGVDPMSLPVLPFHLGIAVGRVELQGRAEREATPYAFAMWLVDLAQSCARPRV